MLQSFWVGTDFQKLLAALPMGSEAVKALLEKQMQNMKALEEANQHAIDAFHSLFNRQNEILHGAVEEFTRLALNGQLDQSLFAKQATVSLNVTQQTLENLRQTSEMVAQASERARQALNAPLGQSK